MIWTKKKLNSLFTFKLWNVTVALLFWRKRSRWLATILLRHGNSAAMYNCWWTYKQELIGSLGRRRRRRRLRERHKTIGLISKNNSSARPARAFYILIHFFVDLVLKTTWNDLRIWGHVEDASTLRWIFNFLSKGAFNWPYSGIGILGIEVRNPSLLRRFTSKLLKWYFKHIFIILVASKRQTYRFKSSLHVFLFLNRANRTHPKYPNHHNLSHKFYFWNVDSHLPCQATWRNRKISTITGIIF